MFLRSAIGLRSLLCKSFRVAARVFWVSQKFRISVIFRKNIMLVLKRRKGQEIIINGHIRIVVVQTNDGSCSLAFDAPDSYRIRRGELPSFDEAVFHESTQTLQVQS